MDDEGSLASAPSLITLEPSSESASIITPNAASCDVARRSAVTALPAGSNDEMSESPPATGGVDVISVGLCLLGRILNEDHDEKIVARVAFTTGPTNHFTRSTSHTRSIKEG